MKFSLNRVTLVGRLTKDPDLRYTSAGTPVCTITVATDYSVKRNDEWEQIPEFTRCVAWRKNAEWIAERFAKGDLIYVEGRLRTNKWQDKEGRDRYTTELVVSDFLPLASKAKKKKQAEKLEDEVSPVENTKREIQRLAKPEEAIDDLEMPF